jgi:hypothetical protein
MVVQKSDMVSGKSQLPACSPTPAAGDDVFGHADRVPKQVLRYGPLHGARESGFGAGNPSENISVSAALIRSAKGRYVGISNPTDVCRGYGRRK